MTQIELIKAEIERRIKDCKKANGHFKPPRTRNAICYDELTNLLCFINSLPEDEPSEDLEKATDETAKKYYCSCLEEYNETGICDGCENVKLSFKAGAEWQKEHMIKEDEK